MRACGVVGSDVTAATAACLANSLDLAAALTQGSNDETAVAAASAPVAVALAALMDCRAAGLVAALSCEAARRDATTFDMPASGDVLSAKDEADVAADIKVLVFGSMVVGAAGGRPRRRRHVRQGPCERRRRRDEINEEESAMAAPVDAGYGCDDFGCNGGVQD